MSYIAPPRMTVCYLSQRTHVHINGCCTLIRPFLDSTSLPVRFDEEVDDV